MEGRRKARCDLPHPPLRTTALSVAHFRKIQFMSAHSLWAWANVLLCEWLESIKGGNSEADTSHHLA